MMLESRLLPQHSLVLLLARVLKRFLMPIERLHLLLDRSELQLQRRQRLHRFSRALLMRKRRGLRGLELCRCQYWYFATSKASNRLLVLLVPKYQY